MDSIAQHEKKIDPNVKTAIIYSISETGAYLVEIHYQSQNYTINENNLPISFANFALAKEAAAQQGATTGYQALENVYQEIGTSTKQSSNNNARYEYVPIQF